MTTDTWALVRGDDERALEEYLRDNDQEEEKIIEIANLLDRSIIHSKKKCVELQRAILLEADKTRAQALADQLNVERYILAISLSRNTTYFNRQQPDSRERSRSIVDDYMEQKRRREEHAQASSMRSSRTQSIRSTATTAAEHRSVENNGSVRSQHQTFESAVDYGAEEESQVTEVNIVGDSSGVVSQTISQEHSSRGTGQILTERAPLRFEQQAERVAGSSDPARIIDSGFGKNTSDHSDTYHDTYLDTITEDGHLLGKRAHKSFEQGLEKGEPAPKHTEFDHSHGLETDTHHGPGSVQRHHSGARVSTGSIERQQQHQSLIQKFNTSNVSQATSSRTSRSSVESNAEKSVASKTEIFDGMSPTHSRIPRPSKSPDDRSPKFVSAEWVRVLEQKKQRDEQREVEGAPVARSPPRSHIPLGTANQYSLKVSDSAYERSYSDSELRTSTVKSSQENISEGLRSPGGARRTLQIDDDDHHDVSYGTSDGSITHTGNGKHQDLIDFSGEAPARETSQTFATEAHQTENHQMVFQFKRERENSAEDEEVSAFTRNALERASRTSAMSGVSNASSEQVRVWESEDQRTWVMSPTERRQARSKTHKQVQSSVIDSSTPDFEIIPESSLFIEHISHPVENPEILDGAGHYSPYNTNGSMSTQQTASGNTSENNVSREAPSLLDLQPLMKGQDRPSIEYDEKSPHTTYIIDNVETDIIYAVENGSDDEGLEEEPETMLFAEEEYEVDINEAANDTATIDNAMITDNGLVQIEQIEKNSRPEYLSESRTVEDLSHTLVRNKEIMESIHRAPASIGSPTSVFSSPTSVVSETASVLEIPVHRGQLPDSYLARTSRDSEDAPDVTHNERKTSNYAYLEYIELQTIPLEDSVQRRPLILEHTIRRTSASTADEEHDIPEGTSDHEETAKHRKTIGEKIHSVISKTGKKLKKMSSFEKEDHSSDEENFVVRSLADVDPTDPDNIENRLSLINNATPSPAPRRFTNDDVNINSSISGASKESSLRKDDHNSHMTHAQISPESKSNFQDVLDKFTRTDSEPKNIQVVDQMSSADTASLYGTVTSRHFNVESAFSEEEQRTAHDTQRQFSFAESTASTIVESPLTDARRSGDFTRNHYQDKTSPSDDGSVDPSKLMGDAESLLRKISREINADEQEAESLHEQSVSGSAYEEQHTREYYETLSAHRKISGHVLEEIAPEQYEETAVDVEAVNEPMEEEAIGVVRREDSHYDNVHVDDQVHQRDIFEFHYNGHHANVANHGADANHQGRQFPDEEESELPDPARVMSPVPVIQDSKKFVWKKSTGRSRNQSTSDDQRVVSPQYPPNLQELEYSHIQNVSSLGHADVDSRDLTREESLFSPTEGVLSPMLERVLSPVLSHEHKKGFEIEYDNELSLRIQKSLQEAEKRIQQTDRTTVEEAASVRTVDLSFSTYREADQTSVEEEWTKDKHIFEKTKPKDFKHQHHGEVSRPTGFEVEYDSVPEEKPRRSQPIYDAVAETKIRDNVYDSVAADTKKDNIYELVYERNFVENVLRGRDDRVLKVAAEPTTPTPPTTPLDDQPRTKDFFPQKSPLATTSYQQSQKSDFQKDLYKDDENIYEEIDDHVEKHHPTQKAPVENFYEIPSRKSTPAPPPPRAVTRKMPATEIRDQPSHRELEAVPQKSPTIERKQNRFQNAYDEIHDDERKHAQITSPTRPKSATGGAADLIQKRSVSRELSHETLLRKGIFTEQPHVKERPYTRSLTSVTSLMPVKENGYDKRNSIDGTGQLRIVDRPLSLISTNAEDRRRARIRTSSEQRDYDRNKYEELHTPVVDDQEDLDLELIYTTNAIRSMSRNNQWKESIGKGSIQISKQRKSIDTTEVLPKNSPFVSAKAETRPKTPTSWTKGEGFSFTVPGVKRLVHQIESVEEKESLSEKYGFEPVQENGIDHEGNEILENEQVEVRDIEVQRFADYHVSKEDLLSRSPTDKSPSTPELSFYPGFVKDIRKMFSCEQPKQWERSQSLGNVYKVDVVKPRLEEVQPKESTLSEIAESPSYQPASRIHRNVPADSSNISSTRTTGTWTVKRQVGDSASAIRTSTIGGRTVYRHDNYAAPTNDTSSEHNGAMRRHHDIKEHEDQMETVVVDTVNKTNGQNQEPRIGRFGTVYKNPSPIVDDEVSLRRPAIRPRTSENVTPKMTDPVLYRHPSPSNTETPSFVKRPASEHQVTPARQSNPSNLPYARPRSVDLSPLYKEDNNRFYQLPNASPSLGKEEGRLLGKTEPEIDNHIQLSHGRPQSAYEIGSVQISGRRDAEIQQNETEHNELSVSMYSLSDTTRRRRTRELPPQEESSEPEFIKAHRELMKKRQMSTLLENEGRERSTVETNMVENAHPSSFSDEQIGRRTGNNAPSEEVKTGQPGTEYRHPAPPAGSEHGISRPVVRPHDRDEDRGMKTGPVIYRHPAPSEEVKSGEPGTVYRHPAPPAESEHGISRPVVRPHDRDEDRGMKTGPVIYRHPAPSEEVKTGQPGTVYRHPAPPAESEHGISRPVVRPHDRDEDRGMKTKTGPVIYRHPAPSEEVKTGEPGTVYRHPAPPAGSEHGISRPVVRPHDRDEDRGMKTGPVIYRHPAPSEEVKTGQPGTVYRHPAPPAESEHGISRPVVRPHDRDEDRGMKTGPVIYRHPAPSEEVKTGQPGTVYRHPAPPAGSEHGISRPVVRPHDRDEDRGMKTGPVIYRHPAPSEEVKTGQPGTVYRHPAPPAESEHGISRPVVRPHDRDEDRGMKMGPVIYRHPAPSEEVKTGQPGTVYRHPAPPAESEHGISRPVVRPHDRDEDRGMKTGPVIYRHPAPSEEVKTGQPGTVYRHPAPPAESEHGISRPVVRPHDRDEDCGMKTGPVIYRHPAPSEEVKTGQPGTVYRHPAPPAESEHGISRPVVRPHDRDEDRGMKTGPVIYRHPAPSEEVKTGQPGTVYRHPAPPAESEHGISRPVVRPHDRDEDRGMKTGPVIYRHPAPSEEVKTGQPGTVYRHPAPPAESEHGISRPVVRPHDRDEDRGMKTGPIIYRHPAPSEEVKTGQPGTFHRRSLPPVMRPTNTIGWKNEHTYDSVYDSHQQHNGPIYDSVHEPRTKPEKKERHYQVEKFEDETVETRIVPVENGHLVPHSDGFLFDHPSTDTNEVVLSLKTGERPEGIPDHIDLSNAEEVTVQTKTTIVTTVRRRVVGGEIIEERHEAKQDQDPIDIVYRREESLPTTPVPQPNQSHYTPYPPQQESHDHSHLEVQGQYQQPHSPGNLPYPVQYPSEYPGSPTAGQDRYDLTKSPVQKAVFEYDRETGYQPRDLTPEEWELLSTPLTPRTPTSFRFGERGSESPISESRTGGLTPTGRQDFRIRTPSPLAETASGTFERHNHNGHAHPSTETREPVEVAVPEQKHHQEQERVDLKPIDPSTEPVYFTRNGELRRSWPVKTYENDVKFSPLKQKLKRMPDLDSGIGSGERGTPEKMNGEENAVLKDWNPRKLLNALYEVSYEPRVETKRDRFINMEGHVEVPSDETSTTAELERNWKEQYMRTKDGRLQVFVTHFAGEAPAQEIVLSGIDIDANREERTLVVHGGKEKIKILIRIPKCQTAETFDKWRQAILSHSASSKFDAYVQPTPRSQPHIHNRVCIIELGSCSIRGGILHHAPMLPGTFFPAVGCVFDDGRIVVGNDAYAPENRQRGELVRPIQSTDPNVERYTIDKNVARACIEKVVRDLEINPSQYSVLLSIPQNIPGALIGELLTTVINEVKFKSAAITRQPSLILYAYDVTTGVVVDIGDRLNIVPVIDGYMVESAIVSIPYGAQQIREALRTSLASHNKGLFSFQSPCEKLILRYVMEHSTYVPSDYEEEQRNEGNRDVHVSLEEFEPTAVMPTKFNIDSSRFQCTEGLFRPKKWGLESKGIHQLINEAVSQSPIDSRRTLFRNIYLAGGASLLPGLAEKLESELSAIVPNSIHTQVHISPWRYNAAFLGAQIIASSAAFEDSCIKPEQLPKFINQLVSHGF